MKKVFLFVLLFSVGKVLADSYPHWVNSPPASANNHLYAVGMSPLTISIAQSISAATANAKTEIISQLRANISGKTDTNNTSIINKSQIQENFSSRNFYNQSTVINTEAKNISGISIVETYVDRDNKSVFALADFDYIKAIADLKNRYSECDNEIKMIDSTLSSFEKQKRLKMAYIKISELKENASLLSSLDGVQGIYKNIASLELYVTNLISIEKNKMSFSVGSQSDSVLDRNFRLSIQKAIINAGFKWDDAAPRYIVNISPVGKKEVSEFYGNVSVKLNLNITILEMENNSPIYSENFTFKGTAATESTALARLGNSINNGIADAITEMLYKQ